MKAIVYISPSMQPENKYAVGNTNEEAQCNRIATALDAAMHRCGMESILPTNSANTMAGRVAESNKAGSALHMPIHTNAFNGEVAGLRIFVYKLGGEAEKIAKAIMAELAPITPGKSDGISAVPGLYEIRNTNATCVYLEVGFHDNPEEAQWIIDHTEDIAEAICKGLCNHYGVKYVAPAEQPTENPVENPAPAKPMYRVFGADGKQTGAFQVEAYAFNEVRKQLLVGGSVRITLSDK